MRRNRPYSCESNLLKPKAFRFVGAGCGDTQSTTCHAERATPSQGVLYLLIEELTCFFLQFGPTGSSERQA